MFPLSLKFLIVSLFLIYTRNEITAIPFGAVSQSYYSQKYCPQLNRSDLAKCRFGYELYAITDKCIRGRCFQGPDERCDNELNGERCADGLRCSCEFCQGCLGELCHRRTCLKNLPFKRMSSKIHSIAELLRRQEQQQLQQQLQFEQEEQRQLQDYNAIPSTLPNEFNNIKSVLLDRIAPYYPFNSSNEIIFNN